LESFLTLDGEDNDSCGVARRLIFMFPRAANTPAASLIAKTWRGYSPRRPPIRTSKHPQLRSWKTPIA